MTATRRDVLLGLGAVPLLAHSMGAMAMSSSSKFWRLPPKKLFKVTENEWIPMPDGVRLGARLWLPEGSQVERVPVVFEYIPYRKRDAYRPRDNEWGPQLAQYGIAYARVDVRGSGDSEGVMVDEYSTQELQDGVAIIEWLSRQPWSNGAVGMRGISWGGINTLQVAAMAPLQLKAIMPMGCCDFRYTDDAHYLGGALGLPNFQWGVSFKSVMAGPPDPEVVGAQWEGMWRRRLEATPAIMAKWLSHQRSDDYWRRGSIGVQYAQIKCPVYVVDGWIDTYSNVVGRLLQNLSVPRKGLIGAWGHSYPDHVSPGPGLDWIYEEVRWWQQWLLGINTGIMDEPMLRAYMPYGTPWEGYPHDVPGRWIAEPVWPAPAIASAGWHLNASGKLSQDSGAPTVVDYVADKIVGLTKPQWLPFPPAGMPLEQGADDEKSLLFSSAPLDHNLEILGYPLAKIRVASNVAVAKLVVRLTDVAPDGKSWLVSYGLLNLTHRGGHEHPAALRPGELYDVDVPLFMVAHRFKQGHRIRIALSESLWPVVWPSPEIATLSFELGTSSVLLPVRTAPAREAAFPIPVMPTSSESMASLMGTPPQDSVSPQPDGRIVLTRRSPESSYTLPDIGTTLTRSSTETTEILEGSPNSCVWKQQTLAAFKRGAWDCRIEASYELTSTVQAFRIKETLKAWHGQEVIFEQDTINSVARDLL